MKKISADKLAFHEPIYVTRPLLPDLDRLSETLKEVWAAQWLTNNGPQHGLLEKELCSVLKVPHLSLFNNGTIALIAACKCLNLTGEVITTPFTFPATPHALMWNNIRPVFCDIDPVTMNIDAEKIEAMITSETTGILPVHVFGTPCDMVKIQKIADRHGLKVIYDAAHAFGVEIGGQGIGTFGDISMFSFHATKLFHTAEGGALTFKDDRLKPSIEQIKNFGIAYDEKGMRITMPGLNGKMNEIQAVLGLVMLELIEKEKAKRAVLAGVYRDCLQDVEGITFLEQAAAVKNSYQYFVIRIEEKLFGISRDVVFQRLQEYNVFARRYFYPLCSEYDCYKHLPSSDTENLQVANRVVREVLSLPFYGGLSVDDVEKICDILISLRNERP